MKSKTFFLCLLALLCFSLQAQNDKLRIAVLDPTSSGTGIDDGTKMAVREIISSVFVNTGKYTIVERSLLEKVMSEQTFSNSGAVNDSEAAEIGRLAGANKIVLSVVTLAGGRNMLSIKLVDVNTASVERQKIRVITSEELLGVVEPLTLELMGESASSATIIIQPSSPNSEHNNTSTKKTNEISPNEGDYALLYIYRPKKAVGSLLSYNVHLGNEVLYNVSNNSKTTIRIIDFEQNTVWAKTESKSEVYVNFKPGHEYYIRCGMKMGVIQGRPTLKLMDESTGKKEFDKIK